VSTQADPAAVRSFLIGTAIGFVVVGGFCVAAIAFAGGSVAGALAVGLMCGVIGGPGFGGMMGFVLHQDRMSREQSRDSGAKPTSPRHV
jgi:hypothetical protein